MNSGDAILKTAQNFLCVSILAICVSSVALAQAGRGGISGLISDPSGAIVGGAQVTALNHATGIALHTVASDAGLYSFVSLTPGVYLVTASQKGFESVAQDNVLVTVDQVSTANIALRVGGVNEVVTVSTAPALVDTTNSTVGTLIDSAAIDRVPLLTRNVFDLVQLSAGVTPANGAPNSSTSQAIINISSGRPGVDVSSYTINGAIQGSVYYMIDGSPLGIAENNIAAIIPAMEIPEDGVEEVRVETQNTPASYQSGGAGVISVVSKSGGDRFHGDGFVVLRPDVLAANEFFNKQSQLLSGASNTPPSFHRYQEGGAIGGPIIHEKLFFFADFEATQEKLFDGSNIFTVPTTAERNGDFSNDSSPIYNPFLPDNPDGTRQAFVGNILTNPTNGVPALDPIAVTFLSHFPKCNFPDPTSCEADTGNHLGNFYAPGLDPITAKRFDVRLDFYKSEKQRLFSRFSFARLFQAGFNAFNNDWDEDYAQNITNARNFLIGDDITINPTTVLQLRYSFTRHYEAQGGDPQQNGTDLTALGFDPSLAAAEAYKILPNVFFTDLVSNGLTSGLGGTANYNTLIYASENNDASATLTKVLGKHELSMGAEYMKRLLNVGQPPSPSGSYEFDISSTSQTTANAVGGSDFASFLLGMGNTAIQSNFQPSFTQDLFVAEANPYYAAFFEDTYHATKTFTVTAGLRWDIFGGKTERHNRLEYFDPTATYTVGGVPYTGGEVFASNGHRSPFNTNFKNFGPRLGFSWQAVPHLVVRGGAGFYFGPSAQQVGGATLDSDGYSTSVNWIGTCSNADNNTVLNGSNQCVGAAPGSPAPSVTGPYSLSNPFPPQLGAGLVPPSQLRPSGLATGLGGALNTMLHSQRTLETYNFNFGLEYELPREFVVSAAYVGSRGLFLPFGQTDLNQLSLAQINQIAGANNLATANYDPTAFYAAEPFQQFTNGNLNTGVIVHGYPAGDSEYSSLQLKVQKRLTHHFTTLASFTWAKLMTDDGNPPLGFVGSHVGLVQDWKDLRYEHSISPQDVKYQLTWQASYDLPVGKDRAVNLGGISNAILGNWTVDGIFYLSSGIPIASPEVGTSPNPNVPGGVTYVTNQRADMICDPSKGAPHTATVWFNPNCFAMPGTGVSIVNATPNQLANENPFVAGNAPAYLDHVRTMGANDLDLTFSKIYKLGETRDLRFNISCYNVANRAQLGAPTVAALSDVSAAVLQNPGQVAPAGFGQIGVTLNTPRQFQFGARFTF